VTETRAVKAAATAHLEDLAVARTWPAANSPGPAKKVKAAQGKLHAQLLLALHSQSTWNERREKSRSHPTRKAGTGHSCLLSTAITISISSSMKTKILTHAPRSNTE